MQAPHSVPATGDSRVAAAAGAAAASRSLVLEVPAGGAVVFSSRLWHCSGPNGTDRVRRVFYAQYSEKPIGDGADARRMK